MLKFVILLVFIFYYTLSTAQNLVDEAQFELPKSLYKAGIQKVFADTSHKKIWISFVPEKTSFSEENPNHKKKFEMVLNQNTQIISQHYSTYADTRPIKIKYTWKDNWIGIVTRTNNQTNPTQKEVLVVLYDHTGNPVKEQFFTLCPAKQMEKYEDLLIQDTLICFYEKETYSNERTVDMLKINLNTLQIISQKTLSLPNLKFGLLNAFCFDKRLFLWSAEIDLQRFGTERVPHKNTLFELNFEGQIVHSWSIYPEMETNYLHFASDREKNLYVIGEYTKYKSHDEMMGIFVQKLQPNGLTAWTKAYDYKGELQKSIRTNTTGSMLYTQGGLLLHKLFYTQNGELIAQAELFIKRQYSTTNFNSNTLFMGGIGGSFADPYTDYEYFDILLLKFDANGNYLNTERIPRTRQVKTYTGHLPSHKPVEKSFVFSRSVQDNIFIFYMNVQHNGKYHYLYACKYHAASGQVRGVTDLSTDGFQVIDNIPIQALSHNQVIAVGSNSRGNLLWIKSFILE